MDSQSCHPYILSKKFESSLLFKLSDRSKDLRTLECVTGFLSQQDNTKSLVAIFVVNLQLYCKHVC
jgi:hypothetical protein